MVVGVCVALYAVLHLVAAGTDPAGWELDLVDAATRLPGPVGWPLRAVMNAGTTPWLPAFAVLSWLVGRRPMSVLTLLAAGHLAAWSTGPLKDWPSRERPVGVRIRDHVDSFGFPSGHTACAFAIAGVLAAQMPKCWRPLAYGLAACAGLGRMHVGAHHLLDVVGGAAVGLAIAHLLVAVTSLDADPDTDPDEGPTTAEPAPTARA
jgi:undecaprenyl-diphosphatase